MRPPGPGGPGESRRCCAGRLPGPAPVPRWRWLWLRHRDLAGTRWRTARLMPGRPSPRILRSVPITDPHDPHITGYYIPDDPTQRRGPIPAKLVHQAQDVLVDRRGVIY